MNVKHILLACLAAGASLGLLAGCNSPANAAAKTAAQSDYPGNRPPLQPTAFIELPLGAITPSGWLAEMLDRQRKGATGRLDELYPQVMGPRNGWLGGDGDQWERGPYWIDGLLPLAYILKDSALIAKVQPWIEWSLASQQEDGYFGPTKDYPFEAGVQRDNCRDWWPKMVMLKVMQQYYSATGDERVIDFMTRYFHYQLDHLDEFRLDHWTFWARFRACDNMQVAYWLYNLTGDEALLELGRKIYAQSEPFTRMFLERDKLTRVGTIHAVNLAQGIKTPVIHWQADPRPEYLEALDCALEDLRRFHGYPTGMFSGDEAIHGSDPTQGVELCTIVEFMFSLESMYRITGDPKLAEQLERIAYNALPTQIDDDFLTRQYFQQVNQVRLTAGVRNFDVNHDGLDCCFGLLTGYPCCTSNMHQGWPKFTQNLWYATAGNGVAVTQYAASEVRMKVGGGVAARIAERTDYPFGDEVRFTVEELERPVRFPFTLRVPSWSRSTTLTLNGEAIDCRPDGRSLLTVDREWRAGDELRIRFTPEVRLSVWKENARAVERGPLVFALKLEADRTRKPNTDCDPVYQGAWRDEYTTTDPWNWALIDCPAERIPERYAVEIDPQKAASSFPWNEQNAPITLRTRAARVPLWTEYNQMAGPLPYSIMYGFKAAETADIELIPYGCTTLRIAEFPMAGAHSAE